ncbi:GDP-mannose 4,6-dehydratase, partial [Candidatus Pelagibacter sp.]|nr:GDP-mannose 4,6-dehydratase [Candidatus Pelagibacter sp.]
MKKKILITGAEGFLGRHLANYLSSKNKLYCLVKKFPKVRTKKASYIKCDITKKDKLKKILKTIKPEVIFHLAAKSHPLFSFKFPAKTIYVNTIGTINIMQNVLELNLNPKIVIACSSAQYGTRNFKELPLKEENLFKPDHVYGLSKYFQNLLANQYFKMFNLKVINAIIFNTSGPGKNNDVFFDFSNQYNRQIKHKKEILIKCGNLSNKRDFLHYEDTIKALDVISKKGKIGESYNISTGKLIKISQLLDYIKFKSSKKINVIKKEK